MRVPVDMLTKTLWHLWPKLIPLMIQKIQLTWKVGWNNSTYWGEMTPGTPIYFRPFIRGPMSLHVKRSALKRPTLYQVGRFVWKISMPKHRRYLFPSSCGSWSKCFTSITLPQQRGHKGFAQWQEGWKSRSIELRDSRFLKLRKKKTHFR